MDDDRYETADSNGSRTMASALTEVILQDIVTGVLPPGSKLKIRELAERYQAGTIPLREAVSRLAMSGFVEAKDQKGFRVTPISQEDLEDITAVRQRIETDALRDAIERGGAEWEGSVLAAFHQMSCLPMTLPGHPQCLNPAWERAHDCFHATLLSGSRSKWLKQFASVLRAQSARYRHQSLRSERSPLRDVADEHQSIVKAILAHDADRACELLSAHFAATTQLLHNERTAAAASKPSAESRRKK
ncbi:GntR family transcriptional regulator [Ralstonia soli]|uniref:FCD domain-containing protein n=1 Tax=Ralstonia soli TaxID=2953896 RepID=A0ABT1AKW2_9RALS|nr:FCD domain-containing protein [Ralstonia soli]MCO5399067.1 FCD domain-containing protein [Ralstonia soli]